MIRDLHRRRGRERRGLALAEGVRLVEEAVAARIGFRGILVSPALEGTERGRALKAALARTGATMTEATDDELADLAATEHPQGVISVIEPRRWSLDDIVVGKRALIVILDALQDPGNVGTIARTALAFGATALISLPGTAELTNPKTLRSSMGALFRLPAVAATEDRLGPWLESHGVTVAATSTRGVPFDAAQLPKSVALVLGNEGAGLSSELGRNARLQLSIPLREGAESLNVAVAAGILLYGASRDR